MVMKMNKTEFIKVLSEKLNVDEEYARKINDILEDNFFIGKKNKAKLVNDFITRLNISESKANEMYESIISIIGAEIKEKIKHPFRSKD